MIFFNECLIYYFQRWKWETIKCETNECNRILIVADPQILGEEKESRWFARYDNDRHMSRSYQQAFSHVDPDIVIFLGDLIGKILILFLSSIFTIFFFQTKQHLLMISSFKDILQDFWTFFQKLMASHSFIYLEIMT